VEPDLVLVPESLQVTQCYLDVETVAVVVVAAAAVAAAAVADSDNSLEGACCYTVEEGE
jgi:hypothetical protein